MTFSNFEIFQAENSPQQDEFWEEFLAMQHRQGQWWR